MNIHLGYCCINNTLKRQGIRPNRGLRKNTFETRGMAHVSTLVLDNFRDTLKIMEWNAEMGIRLFRLSSSMMPWMTHWSFNELSTHSEIRQICETIGNLAKNNGIRLTWHPGHFNVLSSNNSRVVNNTVKELEMHSEAFDMMNLEASEMYPMNIHMNSKVSYERSKQFAQNLNKLSSSARSRLIIENDDKPAQWSVNELVEHFRMHTETRDVPITFDFLHHKCNTDNMSVQDAFNLARSTWNNPNNQLCHYSSSKTIEDSSSIDRAHADYIYESIHKQVPLQSDEHVWIELEAKAKESALFKYSDDFIIWS